METTPRPLGEDKFMYFCPLRCGWVVVKRDHGLSEILIAGPMTDKELESYLKEVK